MTLRDLLLVLGAVPLLAVVALRLAAEMGLVGDAPPAEALTATLVAFGVVFVAYVALTLRAIARATREILERDKDVPASADASTQRKAAVSDFAIHLDRTSEIDLRDPDCDFDGDPDDEPRPADGAQPARTELFGEVSDLLTKIPSARQR